MLNLEAFIPDNVILGVDECLQRCGIERTSQSNAQRQPRVSANAYPPTISAVNVNHLPGSVDPPASAVYAAEGVVPTGFADDYVPICDSPYDCDAAASSVRSLSCLESVFMLIFCRFWPPHRPSLLRPLLFLPDAEPLWRSAPPSPK